MPWCGLKLCSTPYYIVDAPMPPGTTNNAVIDPGNIMAGKRDTNYDVVLCD